MEGENLLSMKAVKLLFTSSCRDHDLGMFKTGEIHLNGCTFEFFNLETIESSALFLTHSTFCFGTNRW
ncbi:hypothetical protein Terro_0406 [Terriglobus roseus DSM 18391]|uniref:Uncharacterized protein n=1 Tax=Terriglobus roseus (strain DSM 18391 / NRRL B-41598 / KBS 63) TaxID=926566 RepID=I3ZBY6_TERRK|nr:hypothetical protein Terro_0406 [Terriglobus roseus DSM 18391]